MKRVGRRQTPVSAEESAEKAARESAEEPEATEKSDTLEPAQAGLPNFMTSPQLGLAVLQAFSQERRRLVFHCLLLAEGPAV